MATREPLPGYWKLARELAPASRTTSEFTLPYVCPVCQGKSSPENALKPCKKTIVDRSRPRLCKTALAREILAFKSATKLPGTKVPGSEVGGARLVL
jgi:hypothetical protein